MGRFKESDFVEEFNKIHGEKYEYLGYENGLVKFLCKRHNKVNFDTPSHLRSGRGCKLCGNENRIAKNRETKEHFIENAKLIHGGKYDYSKVDYIDSQTKVCIICPEHGEFWQSPNSHLNGKGCKKCGTERSHDMQRKTSEQFILEAKAIHGDKYDYSKTEYVNGRTKVCIICPEHGEFWQSPNKHLLGQGCKKCSRKIISLEQSLSKEEFIERAKLIHGNKYDYSKVDYKGYEEKVKIICPIHGEFEQTPDSHLHGSGCRMCSNKLSKSEDEIYNFISELIGKENVVKSERSILNNHAEIDIFVPSKNIGFEYNGCRWHTEQFGKDRFYHLKKTNECNEKGIRLIHIFEDEYNNKKDIVLNKIRHILDCDKLPRIAGRKCTISEITYNEAKAFLDENHIQGHTKATIYIGAKHNEELVGVMTFVKVQNNEWELNRFATNNKYICQGVGSKIFSYFIRHYSPQMVKSFADRRWTTLGDNLYLKLNFELNDVLAPDYRYVIDGSYERIHKFNFRKQTLHKKYGFDLSMTENEMAAKLNAHKIWDCGLYKYIWKNF